MSNAFSNEVRNMFRNSNALVKLILANMSFFLVYQVVTTFLTLFTIKTSIPGHVVDLLAVPASLGSLLYRPWSLFTYMFVHVDFMHIFFNMLWLYWMGNLFTEYLGGKKLVSTYVAGGISGALLFILAFNTFPFFRESIASAVTIGASAAVMAIVIGISTLIPEHRVNIILFGAVPLKYIAVFYVVIDFISITQGNSGGHLAHLGGALYGFLYVRRLKKGGGFMFDSLFSSIASIFVRKKMKVYYNAGNENRPRPISDDKYAMQKKERQEIIDGILDKISQSGYDSLTKKEKEMLFRMSKDDKE